ncbi:unnamed protein product [Rotaria magnacalcarata]|nr:unnamed protein product [Rotaria magnacalcarata]
MANRINNAGSMTTGRIRKFPFGLSNTQPVFDDDLDDSDIDENERDRNNPVINDVSLYTQQQRHTTIQTSNNSRNNGTYYTPQVKRKRVQDQTASVDPLKEQLNILEHVLKEMNKKLDLMAAREDSLDKNIENTHRHLSNLIHRSIKNPTPSEPPAELSVVKYNERNLLSGPIGPTPACLMKNLINKLFTKEEIMKGEHNAENERTEKIKGDIESTNIFWNYQGKSIRGNQQRGHRFRDRHQ